MKPARFSHHEPRSVAEAVAMMAEYAHDGKILAGGQSLVPLLNFRLASPGHLIDINRIPELASVRKSGGKLLVGSATRQAALERSRVAADAWPVLPQAIAYIAHPAIRNRGTVGGSVAHADPAAELPAVMVALRARMRIASVRGERLVAAEDFFLTHLTTVVEPDEILTEIEIPALPANTGTAFVEYARRHGDFALGGAVATITRGEDGGCAGATIALLGAGTTPVRAGEAESALVSSGLEDAGFSAAGERVRAAISPTGDIHGSAEFRRDLIGAVTERAIRTAAERAGRQPTAGPA